MTEIVKKVSPQLTIGRNPKSNVAGSLAVGSKMPTHIKAFAQIKFFEQTKSTRAHWSVDVLDAKTKKFHSAEENPYIPSAREPTSVYNAWIKKPKNESASATVSKKKSATKPAATTAATAATAVSPDVAENTLDASDNVTDPTSGESFVDKECGYLFADPSLAKASSPTMVKVKKGTNLAPKTVPPPDREKVPLLNDDGTPSLDKDGKQISPVALHGSHGGREHQNGSGLSGSSHHQPSHDGSVPSSLRIAAPHCGPDSPTPQHVLASPPNLFDIVCHSTRFALCRLGSLLSKGVQSQHGQQAMEAPISPPRTPQCTWCTCKSWFVHLESSPLEDLNGQLTNVEECSPSLAEGCVVCSTCMPAPRNGLRHSQSGKSEQVAGNSSFLDGPLASLWSQGRCRASPVQGRHDSPGWSFGRLHPGGQGCTCKERQVPRHFTCAYCLASRIGRLFLDYEIIKTSLLVSSFPSNFGGSQPSPPSSKSSSLDPLSASWSSPNNGSERQSGHQDRDGNGGTPSSQHHSPLPRVGQGRRKEQEGTHQRCQTSSSEHSSLTVDDQSPNARLSASDLASALDSTVATSSKFANATRFEPSTADILAGSTAISDLSKKLSSARSGSVSSYPAHIKHLDVRNDFDALEKLEGTTTSLQNIKIARPMINDENFYKKLELKPCSLRDVPVARGLTPDDSQRMIDAGVMEFIEDEKNAVIGSVINVFCVDEPHKNRKRVIQHTKLHNELLEKAPKTVLNSIEHRCDAAATCNFGIEFDMKASYTQIPLDPAIRKYFYCRLPTDRGNKLARLCVAATGQSHIVFVAVAGIRHLSAFALPEGVETDDHIDNFFAGGARFEDVLEVASTFRSRASACGFTINDVDENTDIASMIATEGAYCGIYRNFATSSVSLTEKTVSKIELSMSLVSGWSWRGFAGHMGLLFFSMQILKPAVYEYFNLLRFVSSVGFEMQSAGDTLWDAPARIPDSAMNDLKKWTASAVANTPRHVATPIPPNVFILMDASSWGWGYVAYDSTSGTVYYHGEKWSPDFVKKHGRNKLRRSTFTEPWGIHLMKKHLVPQLLGDSVRHLLIGSDNVTAVALHRKRYSGMSFDLNCIAAADCLAFPTLKCSHMHVAGEKNVIADAFSRGKALPDDKVPGTAAFSRWAYDSLRRLLGVDPGGPLSIGGGSTTDTPA